MSVDAHDVMCIIVWTSIDVHDAMCMYGQAWMDVTRQCMDERRCTRCVNVWTGMDARDASMYGRA